MFRDLIGKNVSVFVATKGDTLFEYTGVLISEEANHIVLENAQIGGILNNLSKNFFSASMTTIKDEIKRIHINKEFIISCNE